MLKKEFLSKLEHAIKKLPSEERNDILSDYDEYFTIGLQDGKTEGEIAAALGSPEQLGRELSVTYHVEAVEGSASIGNFFRALWAVIGLGFFNLVIVLGPFIVLGAIIISGWAVAVAFILSPMGVLINTIIYPEIFELFNIFFSIALAGAGLFIGIMMIYLTKWINDLFVKYFQFNVRMVKGGMKNV